MAASVRHFRSRALDHRHLLFNSPAPRSLPPPFPFPFPLTLPLRNHKLKLKTRNGDSSGWDRSAAVSSSNGGYRAVARIPYANQLFLSLSCSDLSKYPIDGSLPEQGNGFHLRDSSGELAVKDGGGGHGTIWTVVLIGWLGAEEKHLKRYAYIYHARGIRSVRFVVPLRGLLGLDLGRKLEKKIAAFTEELTEWCSQSERDGRKRHLLFHTFSNTGWLVYGSILKNLQSRNDVIDRIKGCVIDSGSASEISPKVWAAGFCAALMKKRSPAVHASPVPVNGDNADVNIDRSNSKDLKSDVLEIIAMFFLEKVFSIILILPDVHRRLSMVISVLSKSQPPCPQLYLYSSADRVIPASSVESFMQGQKAMGRNVRSYNFGTSPHVDHFRSFPHIYSAKISEFVDGCLSEIVCRA